MSTLRYTTAEKDLMLSMSLDLISGSNISDVSINYGSLTQYSGSIYPSSSFSGSVIIPVDPNLIFDNGSALGILIPSSSYLDSGSLTSASISSFMTKYDPNGAPANPLRIPLQIIENQGNISLFPCNTTDCYPGEVFWTTDFTTINSPTTFNPDNRDLQRPLKGGISISSTSNLTPFAPVGSVGTMGAIIQDSGSGALLGLTNNHVVIRDAFYTDQRTFINPQNEYDLTDPDGSTFGSNTLPSSYTQLVYQDAEDGAANGVKEIGRVLRYIPLYTSASTIASGGTLVNKVDGALFSLYCTSSIGATIIDFTSSYQQLGFTTSSLYTSSLPFASTTEIDGMIDPTSPYYNPPIYSAGRTTGTKGEDPCPLRFSAFVNIPTINYSLQGNSTPCTFVDVMEFVKPENAPLWKPGDPTGIGTVCPWPGWGGDSGSTVIANFSGTYKIIGLLFAGNGGVIGTIGGAPLFYPSTKFFACRIDHVASELGIREWTGSISPAGPHNPVVDHDTIDYRTVSGSNDDKILNCSGSNYYQVGLTTNHKIC
jgi:hypothetical protein